MATTNKFYQKRIFSTLTKNLDKSQFEVTGDTLTLKNIIKTDITKQEENLQQDSAGQVQQDSTWQVQQDSTGQLQEYTSQPAQ